MQCWVYKGDRKSDHYLYLSCEADAAQVSKLPEALLELLGELRLVVEFDLHPQRELPQAQASQVLSDIQSQGFYLQMPKKDMLAVETEWFN